MKRKKVNAALGLLSILCMLLHAGYSVFAYLTMYYNPVLKWAFAIPCVLFVCLHAVGGMAALFLQADGTRLDLYPRKNAGTVLQRVSAALIFPLLILHLYTFSLMQASAENGRKVFILLLILAELLFFAAVITHIAVSVSGALITLGLLSSPGARKAVDLAAYLLGAAVFLVASYAVVAGQAAMFLQDRGGAV